MERKTMIIFNEEEKMALREAGRIMERACELAESCVECPLHKTCNENTTDGGRELGIALQKI